MARKRKISKTQMGKVALIQAFLDTEIGKTAGILIDTDTTHVTQVKAAFQNAHGFYITAMGGGGDRMTFSEIHSIYTACAKDEDFKAYVDGVAKAAKDAEQAEKDALSNSLAPVAGKPAANDANTADNETERDGE